MSEKKYRLSKPAVLDLNSIWLYTCQKWSKSQADRYYDLIISEIKFIADNFNSGKSIEHIRPGYFVSIVKSHLIFYRRTENGMVEIIRILHQRMNIKKQLE
jgi:toxin ParE1/3/4